MLHNPNTPAALLNRAADIMEKNGLAIGNLRSNTGYCIQGALMSALGISDEEILNAEPAGWADEQGAWGIAHANDGYNAAMTALFDVIDNSPFNRYDRDTYFGRRSKVAVWNNNQFGRDELGRDAKDRVVAKMREAAQTLVDA